MLFQENVVIAQMITSLTIVDNASRKMNAHVIPALTMSHMCLSMKRDLNADIAVYAKTTVLSTVHQCVISPTAQR